MSAAGPLSRSAEKGRVGARHTPHTKERRETRGLFYLGPSTQYARVWCAQWWSLAAAAPPEDEVSGDGKPKRRSAQRPSKSAIERKWAVPVGEGVKTGVWGGRSATARWARRERSTRKAVHGEHVAFSNALKIRYRILCNRDLMADQA